MDTRMFVELVRLYPLIGIGFVALLAIVVLLWIKRHYPAWGVPIMIFYHVMTVTGLVVGGGMSARMAVDAWADFPPAAILLGAGALYTLAMAGAVVYLKLISPEDGRFAIDESDSLYYYHR